MHNFCRSRLLRIFSASLLTSVSANAAFAMCGNPAVGGGGSGPPSITVAEASTTQVLEQIRKRGDASQEQIQTVSDTAPAEAPAASTSGSGAEAQSGGSGGGGSEASASSSAASQSAKKKSATQGAPAASKPKKVAVADDSGGGGAAGGSLKDGGLVEYRDYSGGLVRSRAVWGRGFANYEKHDNIAPGEEENPTRRSLAAGGMLGADWTISDAGAGKAYQLGVFGGYSHTRTRFSDTTLTDVAETDGTLADYTRSNNEQDVDSPFAGAYLSYVIGPWVGSLVFKADFGDLSQSSTLVQTCGDPAIDIARQFAHADVDTYTVASELAYHYTLTPNAWLAPTMGLLYSRTNFSNQGSGGTFLPPSTGQIEAGSPGFDDGYSIRLRGGLRYGEQGVSADGYLWLFTFGAFLYSDVIVEGFEGIAGQTGMTVGPVDEGEFRGLGQLTVDVYARDGWSYQLVADVYGGNDLIGVGGQFGIRYEW